jgi:hypothetical protein
MIIGLYLLGYALSYLAFRGLCKYAAGEYTVEDRTVALLFSLLSWLGFASIAVALVIKGFDYDGDTW